VADRRSNAVVPFQAKPEHEAILTTLYGLKQSGCHWYQKLSSIFISLSFQQCLVNQAIFHKSDKCKKELTVIAVHVNDCTIAASSTCLVNDFKASQCRHVEVTDLGALHWMLGIEIRCDREVGMVHLSQCMYINSILCCYSRSKNRPNVWLFWKD
jgi:hypothetical protein